MNLRSKFVCLFMVLLITSIFMTQGIATATVTAAQQVKTQDTGKKAVYLSGLDLSKYKGEYYTTKKEEYIDTTRFIIYLQKGIEVPVNLISLLNHMMDRVEETTGYQFDVKNRLKYYPDMRSELDLYFSKAASLKKLNHDYPKVEIVVAEQNYGIYSVGGAGMLISPDDIKDMKEHAPALLRGFLYIAWQRYGVYMGTALGEGFVQYYMTEILKKDKVFTSSYDAYQVEGNYEGIITEKNAEDLFLNSTAGSGSDKLGFRLTCYILDQYGKEAYRKVHQKVTKLYTDAGTVPMSLVIKGLKSELSNRFFEEFARWFSSNMYRFGDEDMTRYGDWYINDGTLIKYLGNDADVIVPDTVTRINGEAFMNATLSSVQLPEKLTTIGAGAFYNCKMLKEIVIPESVTFLGGNVLEECSSLKNVVLPGELKTLPASALMGCRSLTKITLPKGLTALGANAFSDCTSLKTIQLPDTLTDLGSNAFSNCTSLKTLILPKNLTKLSYGLFSGCTGLKSIVIPGKITSIGDYAFSGNRSLSSITIPKSVKQIGEDAFRLCPALTIYGPKGSYGESYAKKNKISFKLTK